MKFQPTRRPGFTLVEILVVLGIILVIAALSLSAFSSTREKSLYDKTKIDLVKIGNAVEEYKRNSGHLPTPIWPRLSPYGTITYTQIPLDEVKTNQQGEYIDHWGSPILYYPLPVAEKPGYPTAKKAILAHPELTGGDPTEYATLTSDVINQKLYDRWIAKGSQLRDTNYILISGGPDRRLEYTTAYGVLNGIDFKDDILNFRDRQAK